MKLITLLSIIIVSAYSAKAGDSAECKDAKVKLAKTGIVTAAAGAVCALNPEIVTKTAACAGYTYSVIKTYGAAVNAEKKCNTTAKTISK